MKCVICINRSLLNKVINTVTPVLEAVGVAKDSVIVADGQSMCAEHYHEHMILAGLLSGWGGNKRENAERYAKTIHESRKPMVVECPLGLPFRHSENEPQFEGKWQYKNLSWKVDLETILTPVYSSSRKLKKQAAAHRAVLAFFGHVCRADGTLWYSYDSICKHTNLGRATVSRVLKNFKTVGLLDWHTVTGNAHKKGHNIYTLSLSALQSAPKIDGAEFPSGTERTLYVPEPLRGLTPEQIRLKYEYATAHGGCSEVEYRMLADAVRQIEGAE